MATDTENLIEYAEEAMEKANSVLNFYSFRPEETEALNTVITYLEQFKKLVIKRKNHGR